MARKDKIDKFAKSADTVKAYLEEKRSQMMGVRFKNEEVFWNALGLLAKHFGVDPAIYQDLDAAGANRKNLMIFSALLALTPGEFMEVSLTAIGQHGEKKFLANDHATPEYHKVRDFAERALEAAEKALKQKAAEQAKKSAPKSPESVKFEPLSMPAVSAKAITPTANTPKIISTATAPGTTSSASPISPVYVPMKPITPELPPAAPLSPPAKPKPKPEWKEAPQELPPTVPPAPKGAEQPLIGAPPPPTELELRSHPAILPEKKDHLIGTPRPAALDNAAHLIVVETKGEAAAPLSAQPDNLVSARDAKTPPVRKSKNIMPGDTEHERRVAAGKASAAAREAARDPVVVKYPEGLKGNALLYYALKNERTLASLLDEMHKLSGGSQNYFAQALGLDRAQYGKIVRGDMQKPPAALIEALTQVFAPETPEERIEWRKFICGIPADINQETLNHCFEKGAPHAADTEAIGENRPGALDAFFTLVMNRHGYIERTKLAEAIAAHAGAGDQVRLQLQAALNNLAGPKNAGAKSTLSGRARTMNPDMAQMFAAFAFPDSEELRAQCVDFLSSKKYYVPEDVVNARKSAALRETHRERGESWKARASKPDGGQEQER